MYLDDIIENKRSEVENLEIISRERNRKIHDPVEFLSRKPFIAEIKKASPSAGEINTEIDIVEQARIYESSGAGAVSVLTDEKYFQGKLSYMQDISEAVGIPVLCKDFIISEKQVENAYRGGADFILLIAAVLDAGELLLLSGRAAGLNLTVLYELHSIEEFEKIEPLKPEIVGVNSRNLKTFEIDKNEAGRTIRLLKDKGDFLTVAESGITGREDIRFFRDSGADAFLIGTSLMKSGNPREKMKEFYSGL